jgi:transcriptional regulator with XRE-family HTH domain
MGFASVAFMVKTRRGPGPVGVNLKRLRGTISQRELGLLSGVSYVTIANLERGEHQAAEEGTLRKIAAALHRDVADLLESDTVARGDDLVRSYLSSPWAAIDKPTEDELEWLRALPGIVFIDAAQSPEAVSHLLKAHRSSHTK